MRRKQRHLEKELLTYNLTPIIPLKVQTFESMDINPLVDISEIYFNIKHINFFNHWM